MAGFPVFPSARVRKTPYHERVTQANLSAVTVYNHMLLPSAFESLEGDYRHLKQHVQIWDVACERQVQLKGKDARKLATLMSARDLSGSAAGRGYYAPLCDGKGGIINDPIALCLSDELFWFSIADSDVLLWAKGLAEAWGLDVELSEPDVSPLAIQGPKAEDLMAEVFGPRIRDIKFFRYDWFEFADTPMLIQRSGWSKQGGFEIYLPKAALGLQLWDTLWEAGNTDTYQIKAGCPNLIERLEGGLLSWGSDMDLSTTPLEVGLEKYCALDKPVAFIGKQALLRQRDQGLTRRLVAIDIDGAPLAPLSTSWAVSADGQTIGKVTSAVYSPDWDKNIALAMVGIDFAMPDAQFSVATPDGPRQTRVRALA